MGRRKTIGIKTLSRKEYNLYYRAANKKSRDKKRERRELLQNRFKSNTHKACIKCQDIFPKTDEYFYKSGNSRLGVRYLSSWCKSCHHKYLVARKYRLSRSEYDKLVSGYCDICWKSEKMFIDHCHVSNRVRGVLCSKCNAGIGFFNDSPTVLRRAAEYLEDRS